MKYFAIIDGQQQGPFTLDQLPQAGVGPDTYVWCKTMDDWQQARTVAEICRFYRQHLAAIMNPGSVAQESDNARTNDRRPHSEIDDEFPLRWRGIVENAGEQPVRLPEEEIDLNRPPHNWVWEAILIIFCCLPIGLAATWFALRSRRLWRQNQPAQSHAAARTAKILILLGLCFTLILIAVALRAASIL